ncbi:MAG: valine--tRNA ligase [archaeon]
MADSQNPATVLTENRWAPEKEAEISALWERERTFAFKSTSDKPVWTIDTPPPYASGTWHVGGAVHYSSIDIIARYKRMKGFAVNYMMGIDRNGLPVEVQTEKEFKVRMYETDRKHFLALCRQLLDKYETEILRVCKRLGCSNNSLEPDGVYRTDSPEYRKVTQATFIEMWKRGLVYQDDRPNNWCTDCGTTIADAEIEYKDKESKLIFLNFSVKGASDEKVVIATSRPELICACACVLVNPSDERYNKLHGKTLITPIFGKEVQVIAHPEAAMDFGTGVVMICSYGDYTDVRLFRNMGLASIKAISPEGKMTEVAGNYAGLRISKAREQISEDLEKDGYVVRVEKLTHRTPVCWRSKTPIEFVSMPEFYLRQKDSVAGVLAESRKIKFHPEASRQILEDWLASVTLDWPISRRRYYGTELPIWYCNSCGEMVLPEGPGKYYQPWQEACPVKTCPKCGAREFTGEKRTFDTWFDSSISELVVSGHLSDPELFAKAFPVSVRPQGKDIVRTWLYYTLLRAYLLFDKPAFEHVWISGHVVDERGEKMSKSVGNVIMPEPLIDKYGADAFRLFSSSEALLGSDLRFSEERLRGSAKVIQKLYNIAKFISGFPDSPAPEEISPADKWILSELDQLVIDAEAGYEEMDFFIPATKARTFTWDIFASNYLELVKARAYNRENRFSAVEQASAHHTLHYCLRTILKVLAPISPFITEYLWRALYSPERSIHLEGFPAPIQAGKRKEGLSEALTEFNSLSWKTKKDAGKSMKDPLTKAIIPEILAGFEKDISSMHNIQEISTGAVIEAAL